MNSTASVAATPSPGPVVMVVEQASTFQLGLAAGLNSVLEPLGVPLLVQLWGENTSRPPAALVRVLERVRPRGIVINPLTRGDAQQHLAALLTAHPMLPRLHVCGDGDLRLAFEAGPRVLGVPVSDALIADADVLARHVDADGWVAWGAVPTSRPVGDSAEALWRRLAGVWCELTRRGCDPVRLRTRGIVTPECGLAGHGLSQAELVLRLAADIAGRIGDQAVATRLTVGA